MMQTTMMNKLNNGTKTYFENMFDLVRLFEDVVIALDKVDYELKGIKGQSGRLRSGPV